MIDGAGVAHRPTIRDVARAAGVNPSTVSRILNADPTFQVSAAVRERVLEVSGALRYAPSRLARGLKTRTAYLIALVVPNIADPFFARMYRGASREAETEGYSVLLADDAGGHERLARLGREVDGLLLATASRDDALLTRLSADGIRFTLLNRRADGPYPSVHSDDVAGAGLAVDHLVALGHRSIGHLSSQPAFSTAWDRHQGYLAAMARHGLSVSTSNIIPVGFTLPEGEEAGRAVGAMPPGRRPTALFAVNDLVAVGAMQGLRDRGLEVPGDVSVVGYDDVLVAQSSWPRLTTVAVEAEEIGRLAVRQLLDREGPGARVLPVRLVVRASSGPPPPRASPG